MLKFQPCSSLVCQPVSYSYAKEICQFTACKEIISGNTSSSSIHVTDICENMAQLILPRPISLASLYLIL